MMRVEDHRANLVRNGGSGLFLGAQGACRRGFAYPAIGMLVVTAACSDGSSNAHAVAALGLGRRNTCGIHPDGSVSCCGGNLDGMLGAGTDDNPHPAAQLLPGRINVADVVGGESHLCARRTDGTVQCWGASILLGDGNTQGQRPDPITVPGLTNVVQITANSGHTCVLLADSSVRCWSSDNVGEIGDGTTAPRLTPTLVPGLTGVISIAAGFVHTCAVRMDGTVWCWGQNSGGEVGDGTMDVRLSPVQVMGGITNAVQVVTGDYYSCARLADGTAACWGLGGFGVLGNGSQQDQLTPGPVHGLTGAASLAAGSSHVCALLQDGTVQCWGPGGEVGLGQMGFVLVPTTVPGLTGVTQVVAGSTTTCALLTTGEVRCWGENVHGQVCNGSTDNVLSPTTVTF